MAAQETIDDIIDYYVNLLIIQYHNKPKAMATVQLIAEALLADAIYLDVQNGYDVNTAVGVQLDVLGKYADINRFYSGQTLLGYFGFATYTGGAPSGTDGFSDYATFPLPVGKFLIYEEVLSGTLALGDSDFRTLLLLRIIQNNSNFSRGEIDRAIFDTFGDHVIPSSTGNMVMDYFTDEAFSPIVEVARQQGILPKPMAVALRYIIPTPEPYFGFATYAGIPTAIEGFSDYANFGTISGDTLIYADLLTG